MLSGTNQPAALSSNSQPGSATSEPSNSTPSGTTPNPEASTSAQEQPIAQQPPTPKRKPGRRSAQAKLEGAVQFIQQRNEQVDHEQQWAITQSLIGTLTRSNSQSHCQTLLASD
ncbi:hypothetical protein IQ268_17025 [Oculatella sp. LEGE 06141]|uniref:hypothetical protein n=1 Tax=Oculatella sp. LEGE 06141 TaxID=1828648 RepID=UPI00188300DF|nr:hypothetical protein [Oculatella sp. LEGE 06141]MBE9180268.1 hypothetical protein [Oculatella sp. LEGE 06141]